MPKQLTFDFMRPPDALPHPDMVDAMQKTIFPMEWVTVTSNGKTWGYWALVRNRACVAAFVRL